MFLKAHLRDNIHHHLSNEIYTWYLQLKLGSVPLFLIPVSLVYNIRARAKTAQVQLALRMIVRPTGRIPKEALHSLRPCYIDQFTIYDT